MSEHRKLVPLFCDDIRYEIGNKYSLIGCYGDEIVVDKLPAVLPRLCVQLRAITPLDNLFRKLVFRAHLNNFLLAELEVSQDQLDKMMTAAKPYEDEAVRRVSFMAMMAFSPLVIQETSCLRVEAETEGGATLHGGRIWLREALPATHPSDSLAA